MAKRIQDLPLNHKDVVLRVDFNLPLNPDGKIIDDTRIRSSLPTIDYLLKKKCKIILLSHLGRPEGIDPKLSLKQLIPTIEAIIKRPVHFINDLDTAKTQIEKLSYPSIVLLENLRFTAAEENPNLDRSFAKKLATLGQFYIDDAFACSHRAHSSITEITQYFPQSKGAGFLFEQEIEQLKSILKPESPFYLLLGGSKISTKIGVIKSLLPKADSLFIGGAMAFPFMRAQGISTGSIDIDSEQIEQARKVIELTKSLGKEIYLPLDWKCKKQIKSNEPFKVFTSKTGIASDYQAFDIGELTISEWSKLLKPVKTLFWNGPFGMYEVPPFDQGTAAIAKIIASLKCHSVVGGGDSVAAIEKQGLKQSFSHLSTGGGASLEFLEKGTLPGIEALK